MPTSLLQTFFFSKSPLISVHNRKVFECTFDSMNTLLVKLCFKEYSLNFHANICLFFRGQLLKHFHKAHKIVFVTVLGFFNVGLYSPVTCGWFQVCFSFQLIYWARFCWRLGNDVIHQLAAAAAAAAHSLAAVI